MEHKKKVEETNTEMEFTGERLIPNKAPNSIFQEHINRYHFASKLTKNKVVLDVACGTGYGSDYLIKNGAKKIVGLDISGEAINYAKDNYKNSNLTFIVGDSTKLPFENEEFDAIVSFETIEHIKEYNKFLDECERVLKKGGIFICSTPNKRFLSTYASKNQINPFHEIEFYPEDFENLINDYFHYTKMYGQINVNIIKLKCIIFLAKLIPIVPHDFETKERLKRIFNLNINSSENKDFPINEYYKVTKFQNTKLVMSNFLIIVAKK